MSQRTLPIISEDSLVNLIMRLERIPTEESWDEKEDKTNILRRKHALDSLSCAEKVEYAKALQALEKDKAIDSTMIGTVMQNLVCDQLIRLGEIQNRKARPFFLAMFKYHKNCMEEGLEGGKIYEQSRECEVMSAQIHKLCGKRLEEEKKKEDNRKLNLAKSDERFGGFENGGLEKVNNEQVEDKKTSGQKKKSRKRRNKEKSKKEPALGNTSQTEVLQPSKEAFDEKVKVKAELRSKISELELAEEAGKLKISSCIEEENARSSALERKIKDALEKKNHLRAKVEDITSAIERLLEEKRCIEKEQEEVEKNVEEMNKKLEESKEASTLAIKHQTEELENVQEKIRNIRRELDLAEGRPQVNNDLEKFMTRQIEELEEELVCPVCLEVATKAPIYKCSDDHLICRYWSALVRCSSIKCWIVIFFHDVFCIAITISGNVGQI